MACGACIVVKPSFKVYTRGISNNYNVLTLNKEHSRPGKGHAWWLTLIYRMMNFEGPTVLPIMILVTADVNLTYHKPPTTCEKPAVSYVHSPGENVEIVVDFPGRSTFSMQSCSHQPKTAQLQKALSLSLHIPPNFKLTTWKSDTTNLWGGGTGLSKSLFSISTNDD